MVFVGGSEPLLILVVAVSKVVAVAGLEKVPGERVVGRVGAAVRGPDQIRWVFAVTLRQERGQRGAEEQIVRGGHLGRLRLAALEGGSGGTVVDDLRGGSGDDGAGGADQAGHEGRGEGGKFHDVGSG